jgi:PKD repeat protein
MIVFFGGALASQLFIHNAQSSAPNIAPAGSTFGRVVIIAMENQNYGSVFGGSGAPFLNSMLAHSSTITNYHSYGQSISGCSAACYQAFTAGQVVGGDGWCPRASSPCSSASNIASQLGSGNWAAFCEDGCGRGADHFPWIGYQNTWNSCVTSFTSCDGSGSGSGFGSDFAGNLYNTVSSNSGTWSGVSNVGDSSFINYLNSPSPASYIWLTPDDSHNMHDNSISSGDQYLQSLLVGAGTLSNPAPGSVLSTNLFKTPGTWLYLWWDEYDPSPNLEYGTMIKAAYVSNGDYDEYNSLHTLEANWGLPYLTSIVSGDSSMSDLFGTVTSLPLSSSFTYLPSSPIVNTAIGFTGAAVGGTAPYKYSWNFGDGGSATAQTATHTYTSSGTFTTTLIAVDSTGVSAKSSQTITILPVPVLAASFSFVPTQPLSSQSVAFTGSATGGVLPYSYSWTFGDGGSGAGQTPTHNYLTPGTFAVSLDVTDSAKTSVVTSQSITVSSQPQLTATLTISPTSPAVNSTVTFTGTAVNGISPYTFAWNFGDNSKATGATVTHSYNAAGTFKVLLNVTDNAGSLARTSSSLTVVPTGGGVATRPVVIGWGGISLNEVARFAMGNPPSQVFPGQQASDMESIVMLTQSKGMNGIRVSWDPTCTVSPSPIDANYSATQVSKAIQIASYYHFWIILDYHGYTDPFTPATSACWLSFWAGVTNQFKNSYSQIIWEPENEPRYGFTGSACSGATACVPYLSNEYQMFINQTRAQGDDHWIIVENICSYGCGLDANGDGSLPGAVSGYPTVTDSDGHIFISLHSYLDNPASWTDSGADAYAQGYYNTVLAGVAKTGWPALNTEGGADSFVGIGGPNATLTGSAGYSNITLRFIQTLTNLYDSAPTRIGYTWWTAGDWTNTPGAGSLGALQCNSTPKGWGCLLQNKPITQTSPPSTPKFTLTFQGYDYDGMHEETITLNNNLLARLPANDTSQNSGIFRTFALDISSLINIGNNTLTFTHANWDCGIVDSTKNVTITDVMGTVVFSDPTVRALSCAQSITYTFTIRNTSPVTAEMPTVNFTGSLASVQTTALLVAAERIIPPPNSSFPTDPLLTS